MNWNQFLVQQQHFLIMPFYSNQAAIVGMAAHHQSSHPTNEQWIQCQTPPYPFGSTHAIINPTLQQLPSSIKQIGKILLFSIIIFFTINLWKFILYFTKKWHL